MSSDKIFELKAMPFRKLSLYIALPKGASHFLLSTILTIGGLQNAFLSAVK